MSGVHLLRRMAASDALHVHGLLSVVSVSVSVSVFYFYFFGTTNKQRIHRHFDQFNTDE